jgi:hypothetical protein
MMVNRRNTLKKKKSERHYFFASIFLLSIGLLGASIHILNDSGFMTGFAFTSGVHIDTVSVESELCVAENGVSYGLACTEIAAESYCSHLGYEGYIDDSKSCDGRGNYAAESMNQEQCVYNEGISYLETVRCY